MARPSMGLRVLGCVRSSMGGVVLEPALVLERGGRVLERVRSRTGMCVLERARSRTNLAF